MGPRIRRLRLGPRSVERPPAGAPRRLAAGFISEYARFPDDRVSVIVLMNKDDADVREVARGVAALYLQGAPAATGAR